MFFSTPTLMPVKFTIANFSGRGNGLKLLHGLNFAIQPEEGLFLLWTLTDSSTKIEVFDVAIN